MPKKPPSAALRAQLRERIISRITELKLKDVEAAEELGLSPGQMSRLRAREDIFTLDRLIDAAASRQLIAPGRRIDRGGRGMVGAEPSIGSGWDPGGTAARRHFAL